MTKMILFQTGNVKFAIELASIRHMGPKTAAPGAGQGRVQQQTIKHEGRPIKLIDLAASLGQNVEEPLPQDGKMIVVKGSPAKALWADNVSGFITADEGQMFEMPSVFTGAAGACFPKVLHFKEHLVLVADTDALCKLEHGNSAAVVPLPSTERVG